METQWLGGAAGDSGDEADAAPATGSPNMVVASLYVHDESDAFSSLVFPLYAGYNVVGRDSNAMQAEPSAEPPPSQPTNDARLSTWRAELPTEVVHGIFLANAGVSTTHAYIAIEVMPEGNWYTVTDQGSLNKTFVQKSSGGAKMPLRPKVSTALEDGYRLYFGELMCVFSEGAPPEVERHQQAAVTDTVATDAPATDAAVTDAASAAPSLVREPSPSPPPHPEDADIEEAGADSGAVSQSTLPYAAAVATNEAGAGGAAEAEATPATEAVADLATQRVVHPPDMRTRETQAVRGRVDSLSASDVGLSYTAGINADTVVDYDPMRGDALSAEAATTTSAVAMVTPTEEATIRMPLNDLQASPEERAEVIPDAAEGAAEKPTEATEARDSDPVKVTVALADDDADTEAGSQELLEAEAAMAAEQAVQGGATPAAEAPAAKEPAVEEAEAAVGAASPVSSSATTALTEDLLEADAQTDAAAGSDDAMSGARGSANAEDGGLQASPHGQRRQHKSATTTPLEQSRVARVSLGGTSETQRYPETMLNELPLLQNFFANMGDPGAADSPGCADSAGVAATAAATAAATPTAATVDGSGAMGMYGQNNSARTNATTSASGGWRKRASAVGEQAAMTSKPPAEVVATEVPGPPLAHCQVPQDTFDFNETDHPDPCMSARSTRRRSNTVDARVEAVAPSVLPSADDNDADGAQAETTATVTEAAAVAVAAMGGSDPPSDTQVALAWTSVRGEYSAGATPPPAAENAGSEPATVAAAVTAAATDVAVGGTEDGAVKEAGSDAGDAMEEEQAAVVAEQGEEVDVADAGGDAVREETGERAVTEATAECAAEDAIGDPAPEVAQPVLSALNRRMIALMDTETPGLDSQVLSDWKSPSWANKPTSGTAALRSPSPLPSPAPSRQVEAETALFVLPEDKAPKGRGGRRGGSKAATTPSEPEEVALTSAQARPTRARAAKAAMEGTAKAADVETPAQPTKRGSATKIAEEDPAMTADAEETEEADGKPAAAQSKKPGRAAKAASKGPLAAAAADVKTPASTQRTKRGHAAKAAEEDAAAEGGPSTKRSRATTVLTATTSSAEPAESKGRKGKRARGESDEQAEAEAAAAEASTVQSKRARGKAAAAVTTTAAAPAAKTTKAKGRRTAMPADVEAPTTASSYADPSLALALVPRPAAAAGRRAAVEHPAPRVLFSANVKHTEKLKSMVLKLGGTITTEGTHDFTHFVTPEFHRTENLLVALAAGRPVVAPQWVRDSAAEGTWLNTRDHLIQATGKFGFAMEASLAAAKRVPLLRGMTVAFTPTMAKGKVGEMLARVVPHAGGVVLPKLPTVAQIKALDGEVMLIAHSREDACECCATLAAAAADTCAAYDAEVLLTGLLHQQLDRSHYRLDAAPARSAKAPSKARRGK